MTKKILMVVTSHAELGTTGEKTGFWYEELAAPYYEFTESGIEVTIASPAGGHPPADPRSEAEPSEVVTRFRADPIAQFRLRHSKRLSDVDESYDAYFVVGGHGVMWDLAVDPTAATLLGKAAANGKVVGAVCHGPGALVAVMNGDAPLVRGKRVTSFTDDEERTVGLAEKVPFLLESRLRELGARFEAAAKWASHAVRDGRLVTGQNPQSSAATAREVLAALGVDGLESR